jgi:hypothetical protein
LDLDYVFDTEFFLRMVYAGHYPELTDQELSVRVVHGEAKSANPAAFRAETGKLVRICRPALTRSEQLRLLLSRILLWVTPPLRAVRERLFGALGRLRRAVARRGTPDSL